VGVKAQLARAEEIARRALQNPEVIVRARTRMWRLLVVGAAIGAGVASALAMVLR